MILHFSHIGFTDGLTFMCPFGLCQSDAALAAGAAAATHALEASSPTERQTRTERDDPA
jgi:hypothetical protein